MMGIFSPIELVWKGHTFTIKPHKVMGAISRIEDVITLPELQGYAVRGTAPLGKLCMAYAGVLRYAGARVSDDEVYETAFAGDAEQKAVMQAIMSLMKMMLPASARARLDAALEPDGGEPTDIGAADEGNSHATGAASSRKPSKRRSQKANG